MKQVLNQTMLAPFRTYPPLSNHINKLGQILAYLIGEILSLQRKERNTTQKLKSLANMY